MKTSGTEDSNMNPHIYTHLSLFHKETYGIFKCMSIMLSENPLPISKMDALVNTLNSPEKLCHRYTKSYFPMLHWSSIGTHIAVLQSVFYHDRIKGITYSGWTQISGLFGLQSRKIKLQGQGNVFLSNEKLSSTVHILSITYPKNNGVLLSRSESHIPTIKFQ
jgi:hypothetical protein